MHLVHCDTNKLRFSFFYLGGGALHFKNRWVVQCHIEVIGYRGCRQFEEKWFWGVHFCTRD